MLQGCETKLIKSSALDESVVISVKPRVLFMQMALAAQGIENVEGVVRYSTMILKEDKNDVGVLKPYIWVLLKHGTSEDELFDLLAKLYDMSDTKDLMLIGRAAKDCGAVSFARRILSMAQESLGQARVMS